MTRSRQWFFLPPFTLLEETVRPRTKSTMKCWSANERLDGFVNPKSMNSRIQLWRLWRAATGLGFVPFGRDRVRGVQENA